MGAGRASGFLAFKLGGLQGLAYNWTEWPNARGTRII